ncbi:MULTISPECIES: type IV secretion system protein [Burkholderia]|jgi:type IV secretion system protein VirB5|uniref:Haloacid dehalogenase n=2 Tax=Burkholderia cepacia complex TaxID=87882 RepID=A0ABD7YH56_9BURK|nr:MULTISPECIES: type IV secretion system protein [Burkholderia]MCA7912054.1 haloacid dehalogenase [Burkholderia contaminans]MCA8081353.1 haloacid dehalogenase [Burkholderia cepacia]WFN24026.1 haloacid dehalogenase [Burkholderia contaminans]
MTTVERAASSGPRGAVGAQTWYRVSGQSTNQIESGATMKTYRRIIQAAVVSIALAAAPLSHAQGIPTIDMSQVAQAILTVQQLKAQYDQIVTQVQMIKGNRGLGLIFNNPELRNYLPDEWKSVYDMANAGRLGGISGVANEILRQEGMTTGFTAGASRYNTTLASNKAMAQQAYDAVIKRLQNIQSLMQQSDMTQDPAAKADLANRFLAENAQIQTEQTRLALMDRLQQIEEKFAARQASKDMQTRVNADE